MIGMLVPFNMLYRIEVTIHLDRFFIFPAVVAQRLYFDKAQFQYNA